MSWSGHIYYSVQCKPSWIPFWLTLMGGGNYETEDLARARVEIEKDKYIYVD